MTAGTYRRAVACLLGTFLFTNLSAAAPSQKPGPYVALRIDLFDSDATRSASEQRGSGVVVGRTGTADWLVLTNAHVVEAAEAKRIVPKVFAGGGWRTGEVVASDAEADLALIRFTYADPLRSVRVAPKPPKNKTEVETHGFSGGRKYTVREAQLRRDLPLGDGSTARAKHRYFIRTTFLPGESGGAVTVGDRLVALIHGNDPDAGWGLCVDQPSIAAFLKPFLDEPEKIPR